MVSLAVEFSYRRATLADIEFIVAAIIEAERSGGGFTAYERMFDILPDELPATLRTLLEEDMPGSELCCDNFLLAIDGTDPVGCLATWIEAEGASPSHIIRANMLAYVLGAERWSLARQRLAVIHEIDIPRESGTMQIEAVYVRPSYRGRRIVAGLVNEAIARCRIDHPGVRKAQILSVVENETSSKAFLNAGFSIVKQTRATNPAVSSLFPGTGRVLWEKVL